MNVADEHSQSYWYDSPDRRLAQLLYRRSDRGRDPAPMVACGSASPGCGAAGPGRDRLEEPDPPPESRIRADEEGPPHRL